MKLTNHIKTMNNTLELKTKLKVGHLLVSNHTNKFVEEGQHYCFEAYDESLIPKNNYKATMTWYPDKPIWTPEEYEEIKYKFMRIRLSGINEPQFLKDFEIVNFTA